MHCSNNVYGKDFSFMYMVLVFAEIYFRAEYNVVVPNVKTTVSNDYSYFK